jgi:transposase
MTRYIGIDAHAATSTIAVVGPSGKHLGCHVVETRANLLIDQIKMIARPRYLCLEEGTQSAWLYEILSPHVDQITVAGVRKKRGSKNDQRDAFGLADNLRTNSIETKVFKDVGRYGRLRQLSRVYQLHARDVVRAQNRIKTLFRSRAIPTGDEVYNPTSRAESIAKLPLPSQTAAQLFGQQYDELEKIRREAEKQMRAETRHHPIIKLLETIPGIGMIRAAALVSIIVSPHRLRTKRQLWKYASMGVVTWSSSDWEKDDRGKLSQRSKALTRGLNRNHNHTLKHIFKGAATTVIQQANPNCPLYQHYKSLLRNKTKDDLAKLTIARQIAAVTLAVWKKEEAYAPAKLRKTS